MRYYAQRIREDIPCIANVPLKCGYSAVLQLALRKTFARTPVLLKVKYYRCVLRYFTNHSKNASKCTAISFHLIQTHFHLLKEVPHGITDYITTSLLGMIYLVKIRNPLIDWEPKWPKQGELAQVGLLVGERMSVWRVSLDNGTLLSYPAWPYCLVYR